MQGFLLLLWECLDHCGTGLACLELSPEDTQHSQQDKLEVLLGPAQLSSGSSITSVEPGYNKEML